MKKRRILALVSSLAVFGAVLLTGCHQDAAIDRDKAITTDQARQIALQHAGVQADTVVVKDRDIDFDNGKVVYEVDFIADGIEYDYDVDAQTGNILKAEKERDDDQKTAVSPKPTESKPQQSSYISKDKARQIALQHAGISADSVVYEKTELDRDDGRVVYVIEFYKNHIEYEYEIDAQSGKVLDYDIDRD